MSTASCATPGCTNPVTKPLACPKCMTFGVRNVFCGQKCFKENYAAHKQIHAIIQQMGGGSSHRKTPPDGITCPIDSPELHKLSLPVWATSYDFTGPLRPALMSPKREITNPKVRRPDYANHPGGVSDSEQRDRASNSSIRVYGPDELEGECNLRYACEMGREVLDAGGRALRVGVTTDEIDRVVHEACMERDCYPSPLNYYNFPKSVCTSVNEVREIMCKQLGLIPEYCGASPCVHIETLTSSDLTHWAHEIRSFATASQTTARSRTETS